MSREKKPALPILLVDDEPAWLRSLSTTLMFSAGMDNLISCQDSRQVMEILSHEDVSVVLLDLTMPHVTGEELLKRLREEHPDVPVIIMSGLNQLDTAVKCMKLGAFDYFVKTTETERLIAGVRKALSMRELHLENLRLRTQVLQGQLQNPEIFSAIHSRSPIMGAVFRYIEAIAGSSEPILVTGESGTGKELIARAIHKASAPKGPFVAVNLAGLDDNVFTDTLFGHHKGAFTGADHERPGMVEKAAGGILFLDEIGDLNPASQVKLLRLLQEREFFPLGSDEPRQVRARIVCATNVDLAARQAEGLFRKDLYFRLCAHHVDLPPLRQRSEDLPLLLDHFLQEACQGLEKEISGIQEELLAFLAHYDFPGNIRELRGMVFDAVALHRAGELSLTPFKKNMGQTFAGDGDSHAVENDGSCGEQLLRFSDRMPTLAEADALLVEEALKRSDGKQAEAAKLLGISPQAMSKRLKKSRLSSL